jgi:hypothetical protein
MNAHSKIKARYPTKAKIAGLIQIARAAGIDVAGIEVSPDGVIRVMEARAIPADKPSLFEQLEDQL